MRTWLFIFSFFLINTALGQVRWDDTLMNKQVWKVRPLPMEGSEIVYTDVVNTSVNDHDQMFKNALDWYNNGYKTADTRLVTEDKDRGAIAGTCLIHYSQKVSTGGPENIFFSFSIQLTNSGYSYRVYDIYSVVNGQKFLYSDMYREELHPSSGVRTRWDHRYRYEVLSDMDAFITLAINHLKTNMIKS